MGIFGPKGARLVFSCVSAVGATKFAPQADWDLQFSADALTADEFEFRRIAPASSSLTPLGLSTPADEMRRRNRRNPNDIQVPIFYATNREPLSPGDCQRHPKKFFGQVPKATPGLNFGLGRVRIREDAFKLANLQDERDARRLEEIKPCKDEAEWKKKLREAINGDVKKSIIVFVHGCFTDFPRGLEYGGLVKHGCNFSGPMIVFSWPSIGHKVQSRPYAKDEKSVKWSVPQLKEFLQMLLTEFEAKVHVLSYSMGARVVIGALDQLEEEMLAIDEKLKKEGGELRARVRERIRGVVTRSEEAAAGVKVGVRELGSILARERDLLKARATYSVRNSAFASSAAKEKAGSELGQPTGHELGLGVIKGVADSPFWRLASQGKISRRIEGTQDSQTDGGGSSDRQMNDEGSDGVIGGVSEERVEKWEALRSKLGHMIFMAPDEEVERFRHTARRWTRGLRNRVGVNPVSEESGCVEPISGNAVSDETRGTSETVKERVRSGLEAEGPEAVEEAAKRGERRVVDDDVIGAFADARKRAEVVSNASDDVRVDPSEVIVTPELSAWRTILSGEGRGSGFANQPGSTKQPGYANEPGLSTEPGSASHPDPPNQPDSVDEYGYDNQPGSVNQYESANPTGSRIPPSHLATIFSGKALAQNPKPQTLAAFPTAGTSQQAIGLTVPSTVDANPFPSAAKLPSIVRRESAPTVLMSPAVEIDSALPVTDDVIELDEAMVSGGAGSHFGGASSYPGQGSCRATSPASSASSRSFSRSLSSTDLVGEELQQALLWEHLHASGSDACSDRSSDASSRASSRPPSRTSSMADLSTAINSCSGAESVATWPVDESGAGDALRPNEKVPFKRRSPPALGLHLSTSAPILNPDSLEWRFLQSLRQPTGSRQLSDAGAGGSPPLEPSPSHIDEQPEVQSGEECTDDVMGPRFSLYTSQSDWALKLAGLATTKPWARGLARMVAFGEPGRHDLGIRIGATLVVEEGYETIDATEVSIGSRNMGHHYLFHRCILEDITHLLSGANAHKRRFEAITPNGQIYWKIERGDYKPASQPSPALYPSWSTMILESSKVAPAEQQLVYFAIDNTATNSNF